MDVTEALDALRSQMSGCSLVAFADLNSKLVLCTSSATRLPQEELDHLSQTAHLVLEGAVAEGAASVWAETAAGAPAGTAMLLSESEARVFLRAEGDSSEALVCVCAPDADLEKVVDCGRSTLKSILAGT